MLYSGPPPCQVESSKDPRPSIADRPASEMSLETNILHHLVNCLERKPCIAPGSITMTSPTQNEEADLGFDAVVGQPDGRYVVLQFKRPNPFRSSILSFRIPAKQVQALSWWPRRSAFFVLPAVKRNRDLWGAGASLLDTSRIVDVWDLYAAFDEIGLLDPEQHEHSESAGGPSASSKMMARRWSTPQKGMGGWGAAYDPVQSPACAARGPAGS